jgi:hypothetical protein
MDCMIGSMVEMWILMGSSLKNEHWGSSLYEGWGLTVIGQTALLLWTIHLDDHVKRGLRCSSWSFVGKDDLNLVRYSRNVMAICQQVLWDFLV